MVAFYVPITLSASPPPSVVYTDSQGAASGASSLTFSGMNFGATRSDRLIIAGFGYSSVNANPTDAALTIGGVSATRLLNIGAGGASKFNFSALFIAAVPTGTSGNVVATVTGGFNNGSGVGLWAAYGVLSATPYATATDDTNTSLTLSVNVPALGIVVGFTRIGGGSSPTTTWTGLTEDFDLPTNGTVAAISGASAVSATAQTPLSISAAVGSLGFRTGVSASFR